MIDTIAALLDPFDIECLLVALVVLVLTVLAWWEFYAKPCRDSLAAIERALNAAPWMRSEPHSRLRKSA
jgi:hypothetical protein